MPRSVLLINQADYEQAGSGVGQEIICIFFKVENVLELIKVPLLNLKGIAMISF